MARAILTTLEKRYCKGETTKDERHVRSHIAQKTREAIVVDLPLIFSKLQRDSFFWSIIFPNMGPREFTKKMLAYLFELERHNLSYSRKQGKVKRYIKFDEAWRQVARTIREAKKEIQKGKSTKQP